MPQRCGRIQRGGDLLWGDRRPHVDAGGSTHLARSCVRELVRVARSGTFQEVVLEAACAPETAATAF